MGGEDITAVLLPEAVVDFFVIDANSQKIADQLKADWRFARVEINIFQNGMEKAIECYRNKISPELIVIETDDIGDKFLSDLEKLSSLCAEGTDAIIIGPKNDVNLYRNLMELGVKDYLVRPVDENELLKSVAKSLVEKKGLMGSRLISVVGAKGGVGVTTVTQLLAQDIATNLEQKTVVVDLSGTSGTLGIVFGINAVAKLSEAVRIAEEGTDDDMQRICQAVNDKLSILTCGGESIIAAIPNADKIELLLNRLMKKYPIVLVDLSGTSREVIKRVVEISSEVVVVSNALMTSLRNTKALLGEIAKVRTNLNQVDLVINMQSMVQNEEVPLQDIKQALDFNPTIKIKYLPKIFLSAETNATPLGIGLEDKKVMSDIRIITSKIVEVKKKAKADKEEASFDNLLNKIKDFFKE